MWENYSPKSVYAEFESMFSYSNVPGRSIGDCGSECIPSGGLAIYKSGYLKTGFRDRMVMSRALGPGACAREGKSTAVVYNAT